MATSTGPHPRAHGILETTPVLELSDLEVRVV